MSQNKKRKKTKQNSKKTPSFSKRKKKTFEIDFERIFKGLRRLIKALDISIEIKRKKRSSIKKKFFFLVYFLLAILVASFISFLMGYVQAVSDYFFAHEKGTKLCRITNSLEILKEADIDKDKMFLVIGKLEEGGMHLNYVLKKATNQTKIVDRTYFMEDIKEWELALCFKLSLGKPDEYNSRPVSLFPSGVILKGKKIFCY